MSTSSSVSNYGSTNHFSLHTPLYTKIHGKSQHLKIISCEEYGHLTASGYTCDEESDACYKATMGKIVVLKKRRELGICEKVGRLVSSCFPPHCCLYDERKKSASTSNNAADYHVIEGFVKNRAETQLYYVKDVDAWRKEMSRHQSFHLQDVEALRSININQFLKSYLAYQEGLGSFPVEVADFTEHVYLPVIGPVTNFSYLIFIPCNHYDKAQLIPVWNDEGLPCNLREFKECARILAKTYEESRSLPATTCHSAADDFLLRRSTTFYDNKVRSITASH